MPTFEEIVQFFPGPSKATARGVLVQCPAHDDHNPSLHLMRGERGVNAHCHAGCENRDVIAAVGLTWAEMFYEDRPFVAVKGPGQPALTLCDTYHYLHEDGSVYMTVERFVTPEGGKTFRQHVPGLDHLPKGFKTCLFNLPQVIPHCREGGEVWICEGEKDVLAMKRHGLVATTNPMGAGKWRSYFWTWLQGASRVVVVADADDAGRKHARTVADDLGSHGFTVQCVHARHGKDASDHFNFGYRVADFIPYNPHRLRPLGIMAGDLLRKQFEPITWTLPQVLPAGLALLGGPPKTGKSILALDIALAVAAGQPTVSKIGVNQGSVLYLALDNDSEMRLADRAGLILAAMIRQDSDLPLEMHTEWPTGIEAVRAVKDWLNETPDARLVIVDTLVKVEPDFDNTTRGNIYAQSSELLSRWAQLANDHQVTIMMVHHDRKGGMVEDGDWIDRFTGSRGLTATAATLLFLEACRGSATGTLHLTGRDVGEFDFPLRREQKQNGRLGMFWYVTDLPPGNVHVDDDLRDLEPEVPGAEPVDPPNLHVVPDVPEQGELI